MYDANAWVIYKKGWKQIFDPNRPKRKLFTARTDSKTCPADKLRGSKNDGKN